MEISDTQVLRKMDILIDKVEDLSDGVTKLDTSLTEHKERHAMVMSIITTAGKLMIGIPTFLALIGGAVIGFYKLIKGGA